MSKFSNYYGYVESEATSFVDEYFEEALEQVKDGSTDMNDFINDSRLHEWCDNDFIYVGLSESADILEQSNEVEEDSGLWEGQEPREAIQTQAFFTYRNDMNFEISDQLKEKLDEKLTEIEEELESLRERFEEFEDAEYDDLSPSKQEECDELEEQIGNLESDLANIEEAIESL